MCGPTFFSCTYPLLLVTQCSALPRLHVITFYILCVMLKGDFGISKKMSTSMDRASTFVGTPYYLAPEMCQETPYSSKADVWVSVRNTISEFLLIMATYANQIIDLVISTLSHRV